MWLLRYGNVERSFEKGCGGYWKGAVQNSGGQFFPSCRENIFRFPPKGKWEKFLLLCSPTVFFDKIRNNSEPKSVMVVLLEFIVVYANSAAAYVAVGQGYY